jgi:uncharacterized membrane protein YpjA
MDGLGALTQEEFDQLLSAIDGIQVSKPAKDYTQNINIGDVQSGINDFMDKLFSTDTAATTVSRVKISCALTDEYKKVFKLKCPFNCNSRKCVNHARHPRTQGEMNI